MLWVQSLEFLLCFMLLYLFSSLFTDIFVFFVTLVHDLMSRYAELSLQSIKLFSFFEKNLGSRCGSYIYLLYLYQLFLLVKQIIWFRATVSSFPADLIASSPVLKLFCAFQ